ncbi:TerC family protein [Xylanibacillus composti]|uniref:Membrane protein n=1 Tax=Xylanibacillus composti TaxID=1572762 RepID=A0A8J4H236_9BACL|nr:TerC family protein [Xylanibacillus composti]MDT9724397.1 TerC family protein [Xylanibacillus composti]GIQ67992.1 membrane protein [Xylanibacillus composti]
MWDFISALAIIIFIDLILAGDNAIVIAMAARKLPKEKQRVVILWGTFGAIAIRAAATLLMVSLLNLPWLMLAGGLLLVWIAYKLLVGDDEHEVKAQDSIFGAIRTIIIADAAMGIDNVIAVAGAAEGEHQYLLVIIGLLISIPIIIWGSTLFVKLINKYSWILYIGGGVLAYTAAKMITGERKLAGVFDNAWIKYGFDALVILGVLGIGYLVKSRRAARAAAAAESTAAE